MRHAPGFATSEPQLGGREFFERVALGLSAKTEGRVPGGHSKPPLFQRASARELCPRGRRECHVFGLGCSKPGAETGRAGMAGRKAGMARREEGGCALVPAHGSPWQLCHCVLPE